MIIIKLYIKMLKCHIKKSISTFFESYDRFIASFSHLMCARGAVVSFFFNATDKIELISGCYKAIDTTKRTTHVIMNIKQIC